ncbi:uncharacterized protein LOC143034092 [Oratosquilla oratoria]|uniref:uncharacterized protein LOC143034092 n=1 Tax=Oratosquilla oratoria TaxID=337810 RepID=UPI003F76F8B9
MDMDIQSQRHLHALRSFIGNLVEQAERSGGCDCHKPPSLLLVGPPGAGKTYLVKQMSNVCEMPLYGVHSHQVRGAQAVRKLFEQARDNYPSLVFMDDVDAIFTNHDSPSVSPVVEAIRDELFHELGPRKLKIVDPKSSKNPTRNLINPKTGNCSTTSSSSGRSTLGSRSSRASAMNRLRPSAPPEEDEDDTFDEDDSPYPDNNGIIVVAATSTPWLLYKDHELLSRFRGVYLVGLPDKDTRYNILKNLLQDVHHNLSDQQIMIAAEKTEGYTPADLMVVVKTLSYRQLSFLLSMTQGHGSSSDGSTGSRTPLSSDMSEIGSDSDLDGLPESEGHMKRGAVAAAATIAAVAAAATAAKGPKGNAAQETDPKNRKSKSNNAKSSSPQQEPAPSATRMTGLTAAVATAAVAAALGNEWASDSEDDVQSHSPESQRDEGKVRDEQQSKNTLPTRVLTDSFSLDDEKDDLTPRGTPPQSQVEDDTTPVPSPDSAIGLSKSSEEEDVANSSLRRYRLDEPDTNSRSGWPDSKCDMYDDSAIGEDGAAGLQHIPQDLSEKDKEEKEEEGEKEEEEKPEEEEAVEEEEGETKKDNCDVEGVGDDAGVVDVRDNEDASDLGPLSDTCDHEERTHSDVTDNRTTDDVETVSERDVEYDDNVFSAPEEPVEIHLDPGEAEGGDPVEEEERSVGTPVEFELHYIEPPEPLRDDNQAIDSDSDNDVTELPPRTRSRRVAFSAMGAMDPLTVDVGGDDVMPPNVSLDDLPPNISLVPNNLPEPMLAQDRRQEASTDAILLSLLSRPNNTPSDRLDYHRNDLESILNNCDDEANKTSTPIEPLEPTPNVTPIATPTSVTPTPSEGSSRAASDGSSSSGSGARVSQRSSVSEDHKKDDSDSSFEASDVHTIPSSDISTATCNATGETMECRTDSEERLRGLDDNHHQDSGRTSDDDCESKAAAAAAAGAGLHALLNLDDLGEISIKAITLADVLAVVAKGGRSVTDDEIKRYTDFMVWFANVAKSACPHNNSNHHRANAPPLDDISIDSTVEDTPSISKKRKGPLRKLGRFLLKALMFILD